MSRSSREASVPISTSLPRVPGATVSWIASLAMLQALAEQRHHLVDLVAGHGERRHEAERVGARRIDEQPAIERGLDHLAGVEILQRQREQEAAAADLAVAELGGERAQALGQIRAGRGDRGEESRGQRPSRAPRIRRRP